MTICDNSVTSRRPHHVRSVERPHHERTPIGSLRHPSNRRKNGLRKKNILIIWGDVFKETGLVLLSFRLEDLTLRFGKLETKKSLNVQTWKKEETFKTE